MRTMQRIADALVARIVPKVNASAAGYQYSCFSSPCGSDSARRQRMRRFCHTAGNCYAWEPYGCCL